MGTGATFSPPAVMINSEINGKTHLHKLQRLFNMQMRFLATLNTKHV